jgi:pimeloyl-ACP methyl ester carboxylesterase
MQRKTIIMSTSTASTTETRFVDGGGIRFAYRRLNEGTGTPLLFTQHFMGNLDTIDPAVLDGFAAKRDVIWFDTTGVGSSTGEPRSSIAEIAADAAIFAEAVGVKQFDLLGHSMGGQVAQWLTFTHPELVRRLVLVGTSPRGGVLTDPADGAAGLFAAGPNMNDDLWLPIFFSPSERSQAAGRGYVDRIRTRIDRDLPFSAEAAKTYSAARVEWGTPSDDAQDYLAAITAPTLIVNGSHDIVIPTVNSFTLQQKLADAKLLLYPDSGHGAHFQYPQDFVAETTRFLDQTEWN